MASFKYYDGTEWVELAKKSDIPSLSGYATQSWVTSQNYLTSVPSHASSSSTYGLGTTSNYGHCKISNTEITRLTSLSDGVAAGLGHSHNYIKYLTSAPTSNNPTGCLTFVILSSEPSTKYDGYVYFITGS